MSNELEIAFEAGFRKESKGKEYKSCVKKARGQGKSEKEARKMCEDKLGNDLDNYIKTKVRE